MTEPNKLLWVAVIDDDEPVRDSIRWLLDSHGFVTRAFASAEAFLAELPIVNLGCIILDIRMPGGMGGIELHDVLLSRGVRTPVIFITGHGDVPMAVSRMKKGAIDFLEKPFSDKQLCSLVVKSLEHAELILSTAQQAREVNARIERLTGRERQVLERIVAGRLNKQIADDLAISIKTVEAHRASIMTKLNARTMAELMRIALQRPDEPGGG